MSARVVAFPKVRQPKEAAESFEQADEEMLGAAEQIERAANELKILDDVLSRVDKNITAAVKRAVRRAGYSPLRLNSRQARSVCRGNLMA